jgi:hypothetical protein
MPIRLGGIVGQARFRLTTRPFLTQHDGTTLIVTYDVDRVLADIDANHGDCSVEYLGHGVLLVFGAPCQHRLVAGQEHGRTIPLSDIRKSATQKAKALANWLGLFLPHVCSEKGTDLN